MLAARARIGDVDGGDGVSPQIEVVCHDDLSHLAARERADFNKIGIDFMTFGKNERASMRSAIRQGEGGRDVHLYGRARE